MRKLRLGKVEVLVQGRQWRSWGSSPTSSMAILGPSSPTTSASPLAACSCPLPLSWSSLELPSHSRTPERALGSPWRQRELLRGRGPINPVSFRGPFPRQRVIDIIISIFFNANYFFSHVNIKIILNVLIKVDVISDHRIINSAWERLSGEKMFSEPQWQFRVI